MTPETTTANQAGPAPVVTTTFEQSSPQDANRPPLSPDAAARARRDSWRSWAGIAVVVGAVAWFLYDKLPEFRGLDERRVHIILNKDFSLHYPLLVLHVLTGTIALITLCVQITPWVRHHHPTVHRISGRLYVFAGVVPCTLLALALDRLTAVWEGNFGIAMESVAWLGTTVMGYLAARRRRWAQHRRWMIYSFAIALGFLWGAIAGASWVKATENAGHPIFNPVYLFEFVRWGGWIVNLAVAQWWLERTGWAPQSRRERTPAVSTTSSVNATSSVSTTGSVSATSPASPTLS